MFRLCDKFPQGFGAGVTLIKEFLRCYTQVFTDIEKDCMAGSDFLFSMLLM